MGKHEHASSHVHASSSSIPLDERYRGCMWGLFHILNYHQWHYYIKRRLHLQRHHLGGDPGSSAVGGRSEKLSMLANDCEVSSLIDRRKRESGTGASKNSMRRRIRSLIQEDKFRHKGRHNCTSTAPAPSQSIQANADSLLTTPTTDVTPMTLRHRSSSKHSALRETEALLTNIKATDGHIDPNRVDHHEKRPITHVRNDEENLEQHGDLLSPDYQSMNSINNRDVVEGINKELLLKFIRDAGAFSAKQRKELSKSGRLQRLGTFPFPGLRIGNVSEESPLAHAKGELLDSHERNLQDGNQATHAETESSGDREMNLEAESGEPHHDTNGATYAPVIVGNVSNHGKNQAVSRHFTALKQKIKHAMKVNRKEKKRIAIDGILHRIPGDKEFSRELMEEMIRKWKEATVGRAGPNGQEDNKHYATSAPRGMARTPSLEASLHKYAQLFKSSFSAEDNCQDSSFPASVPHYTKLGRIASLPDMKLYTLSADNDSETLSMNKSSEDSEIDGHVMVEDGCSNLIPDVSSEKKQSLLPGEDIHDEQADVVRHLPEADVGVEVSTTRENLDENETPGSPEHELFELPAAHGKLSSEYEHSHGSSLFDIPQDYTASAEIDKNLGYLVEREITEIDTNLGYIEEQEISSKALEDMMDSQIHSKDREIFKYVRHVLETSGLSGKEPLGLLHPNYQLLDRAIYDEVEDIWLHDPSSIKNDEGSGNYDHVLLFDLINEVLLDIYERSFTSYPKTLSQLCRIHRMSGGHRVLEEVWATISRYMSFETSLDQTVDYATCEDLEKQDNWMNLQCDSEGVGIELEDLILDEILEEMIFK